MGAPGGKGSVLFLTWVAATQVVTLEFYVDAEDVFLNLELPWEVVANRSAEGRRVWPKRLGSLMLHLHYVEARGPLSGPCSSVKCGEG